MTKLCCRHCHARAVW